MLLALLVGIISLLLGLLRFGFLIQLISHPVIKSFIIASALLIALGQLKFLVDIPLNGNSIPEFVQSLVQYISNAHMVSLIFGIASILFLIDVPKILNSQAVQGLSAQPLHCQIQPLFSGHHCPTVFLAETRH
jgi:SulP family sulfate permease